MFHTNRVILILLLFSLCTGIATAAIERTITPSDTGDSITVHVIHLDGMIGGITEEIPSGYTFLGSTHPHDQIRTDGSKLHFAVIGEESLTYTLSGDGIPEIIGTTLDLTDTNTQLNIPTEQSPAPVTAIFGAAIISALILAQRRLT
jgi:hypothetical protein